MAPAKMWDAMAAGSHAVRAAVWPGNELGSGRQDASTVPPARATTIVGAGALVIG